jgi:hypothetical protein
MGKITRSLAERRASVPEELKRLLGPAAPATTHQYQSQQSPVPA